MFNYGLPPDKYIGEVQIYGNKIHSFESTRSLPNSNYNYYGITVTSPVSKIYNNLIRFGIDSKGQFIDSVTSLNGILIEPVEGLGRIDFGVSAGASVGKGISK